MYNHDCFAAKRLNSSALFNQRAPNHTPLGLPVRVWLEAARISTFFQQNKQCG
jgi:hypothetical protein